MKSDEQITKDILQAIELIPLLKGMVIAVAVQQGTVTFNGYVHSYLQKKIAEMTAERISEVKSVVSFIEVVPWPGEPAGTVSPADQEDLPARDDTDSPGPRDHFHPKAEPNQ